MARRFLGWRLGCVALGPVWSEDDAMETATPQSLRDCLRSALDRLAALRSKTLAACVRMARRGRKAVRKLARRVSELKRRAFSNHGTGVLEPTPSPRQGEAPPDCR